MRIKASQMANRVGSITPSDGQYTQTGKEAMEEIYNLHSLYGKGVCRQAGDRLRCCLSLNPERLTILSLGHTVLLINCPSCWRWQRNWCSGISGTRYWGLIPYMKTSLPTKHISPLKLHYTEWSKYRESSGTQGNSTWSFPRHWEGLWQYLFWNDNKSCCREWNWVYNLAMGQLHAG